MTAWTVQTVVNPTDWLALAALLREYAAKDLDRPRLSTIWKDLADLPARYSAPQGLALLLRETPTSPALACGAYAATRVPGTCEIKRIYVQPAQRGQGLASALIRALLQQALQAGYTHAALSTWRSNLQGQALYGRLGFAPVPPFKEHPNPDLLFLGRALPSH